MKTRRRLPRQHPFVSISVLLCLILVVSCGTLPTSGKPATPTPGKVATPTIMPMLSTRTSCPPAGTARAAVMAPLVLGRHANLVYVPNQAQGANSTAGTITHYDTTTGRETVIVRVPQSAISETQVSTDGQWVLFRGGSSVYLLTVATGGYRLEVPATSSAAGYSPRTWLDTTHLYLTPYAATELPPLQLSLLDVLSRDSAGHIRREQGLVLKRRWRPYHQVEGVATRSKTPAAIPNTPIQRRTLRSLNRNLLFVQNALFCKS